MQRKPRLEPPEHVLLQIDSRHRRLIGSDRHLPPPPRATAVEVRDLPRERPRERLAPLRVHFNVKRRALVLVEDIADLARGYPHPHRRTFQRQPQHMHRAWRADGEDRVVRVVGGLDLVQTARQFEVEVLRGAADEDALFVYHVRDLARAQRHLHLQQRQFALALIGRDGDGADLPAALRPAVAGSLEAHRRVRDAIAAPAGVVEVLQVAR